MKLNQKLAKRVLAVALTLAMVVTSLFVMPTTANAATGATIGRYESVKAGTTNKTTVRNLGKNYYAKVSVTGTAKNGITITRVNGNKVTATTKIQGTGKAITLNVKNWNVPGKNYNLVVKTYSKKTNKLVRTFTTKSTFVYKTLTKITLDETATVSVGGTVTLSPVKTPATATNKLTWSTSDATIATVKDGVVTGVKEGEATITVKSSNGKEASCKVAVGSVATSAAQNGYKTILVKGAGLSDQAADYVVKRGNNTVSIDSVSVNADKTEAVLTISSSSLSAGDYALTYKGAATALTFTCEAEKLAKIEFTGTNLVFTGETTTPFTYTIGFTALNQFGQRVAPATLDLSFTSTSGTGSQKTAMTRTSNGVMLVTTTTALTTGNQVALVIVDRNTGVSATTNGIVAATSKISKVEVAGVFADDSNGNPVKATITSGETIHNNYYLLLKAYDQYGNDFTTFNASAAGNISLTSSGITKVELEKKDYTTTDTYNDETYIRLDFNTETTANSYKAVAGTQIITIVGNAVGLLATTNVVVEKAESIVSVKIAALDTLYNGTASEVSYIATDSNGKEVTDYATLKNFGTTIFGTQSANFEWVRKADGTAKLIFTPSVVDLTGSTTASQPVVITTQIDSNVNVATLSVFNKKIPTAIAGLDNDTTLAAVVGGNVTIKASNLKVEDQYGNLMTDSEFAAAANAASLKVTSTMTEVTTGAFTTVTSGAIAVTATTTELFKVTGALKGTASVKFELSNDANHTGVLNKTISVVSIDSISSFAIADFDGNIKSTATEEDITVTGKVNGVSVTLPAAMYAVQNTGLIKANSTTNSKFDVVTAAFTSSLPTGTTTGDVKATLEIVIANTNGTSVTKEVLLSNKTAATTTVTLKDNTDFEVTKANAGTIQSTDLFALLDVVDQYGQTVSSPYARIKFSNIPAIATVTGNNTSSAKLTIGTSVVANKTYSVDVVITFDSGVTYTGTLTIIGQ